MKSGQNRAQYPVLAHKNVIKILWSRKFFEQMIYFKLLKWYKIYLIAFHDTLKQLALSVVFYTPYISIKTNDCEERAGNSNNSKKIRWGHYTGWNKEEQKLRIDCESLSSFTHSLLIQFNVNHNNNLVTEDDPYTVNPNNAT